MQIVQSFSLLYRVIRKPKTPPTSFLTIELEGVKFKKLSLMNEKY